MSRSDDPNNLLEGLAAAERCQVRGTRWVVRHVRSAPKELIPALCETPDALLQRGSIIKDGDRTTVAAIELDGVACVVKRSNLKHTIHTLTHCLLRSRAQWYWVNARRLARLGVRVAAPIAICEERIGPLRFRSFLVTEFIDGVTLDVALDHCVDRAERKQLVNRFMMIWNTIGRSRLRHGDPKETNFIVRPDGEIILIDIESVRPIPRGLPYWFVRRREDRRFLRNWRDRPEAEAVFREAM